MPDTRGQHIDTDPNQKEPGILRQILNPGGHKADNVGFGSTTSGGSATGAAGTTTNPSDLAGSAQQESALPTVPTMGGRFMETPSNDPSSNPLASGVARSGGVTVRSSNITSEPAVSHPGGAGFTGNQSSVSQASNSQQNYGSDAILAGAGPVTAVGMYAHEKNNDASQPASDAASTTAVKDFPATSKPTSNISQNAPQATTSAVNPPSTSSTQPDNQIINCDATAVGGTSMALAGAQAAWGTHERPRDDYDFTDPSPYSKRAVDPRVDLITRRMPGAWPRGDSYQSEPAQDRASANFEPTASAEPEVKTHDFGQDAAVAGGIGAAGLGVSELENNRRNQDPSTNVAHTTLDKAQEPTSQRTEESKHHYGRDAAVAGGLCAAGAGAYEADKNLKGTNAPAETTDPAESTVKPEQHVASTETDPTKPSQPEHHYDRDAALAGGAGVAGIGGYEAYKHQEESKTPVQPAATTQTALTTIDKSRLIPTTADHTPRNAQTTYAHTEPESHYGRDAAIAGGVGAAGLGAYEAEKYHTSDAAPQQPLSTAPDSTKTTDVSAAEPTQPQHHYGREATIADGAGAAVYEAEKHLARPDEKLATQTQAAPAQNEALAPHPTSRASSSYSQFDAAPFINYDPPTPQPQPLPPQQHDSHDTAIAGGVGLATWFGADEIDKKHRLHDSMDPELDIVAAHMQPRYEDQRAEMHDHSIERHPGFAEAAEELPAAKELKGKESVPESGEAHHLGRDAVIAGGLGAAGVGAYEADKEHKSKEEEAMAAGTGQPVDLDYEYVKTYRRDHTTETTPQRSPTHLRKVSKEEREAKHGSLLGKIFHRKSRSNMQDESAIAEPELEKEQSPVLDMSPEYGASAVSAEELARRSHDSPPERHSPSATPERHTSTLMPTRSPTEKKHSPKHSGDFSHLGRNKLHKDPPAKYFEKHGAGNTTPPSRMTSTATRNVGTEEQISDPYDVSGLSEDGAHRGVDNGASLAASGGLSGARAMFGGLGAAETGNESIVNEPQTGLPMNVGTHGTGAGGTDGAENIGGFHGGVQDLSSYEGPDWQDIRKNDSTY